jgi:DNA processing protein
LSFVSTPDLLDPADPRPAARAALGDWLALQRALGLKPQLAVELIRRYLDPRRALAASSSALPSFDRAAEIAALARAGAVGVPLISRIYPARLAALADPAPLLLVRGDAGVLSEPAVGIVGARAATVYGKQVARSIAADLAREGIVIVSGLARGIDAEAHRGALEAGGRTVAVQACGIDRVYPPEHRALADRIAGNGAVITELPLGTSPRRAFFPLRNRLISGLSAAVVIVEARERSGSLITATHAANQGRDVFAVPGPITAPSSRGTNRLLRDGAFVALGADEILDELGVVRGQRPQQRAGGAATGPLRQILDALADQPASRDELTRRLGREVAQLSVDLLELELDGRIEEDRDGRLRVVDPGE